jgi:hypothetical protein
MSTLTVQRKALQLCCALALVAVSAMVCAQTRQRSLRAVPQPRAPAVIPTGTPGSPLPSPSGLTSAFPAGLPPTLPHPSGLPDPTAPNIASPGTPAGSPPIDAGIAVPPATNAMGAPGYGGAAYGTAASGAAPQGPVAGPAGPYTPLQIAQSFFNADVNHDGELTRAEYQRLAIKPYTFEEMDRNHDGVITRFEYEDAVH